MVGPGRSLSGGSPFPKQAGVSGRGAPAAATHRSIQPFDVPLPPPPPGGPQGIRAGPAQLRPSRAAPRAHSTTISARDCPSFSKPNSRPHASAAIVAISSMTRSASNSARSQSSARTRRQIPHDLGFLEQLPAIGRRVLPARLEPALLVRLPHALAREDPLAEAEALVREPSVLRLAAGGLGRPPRGSGRVTDRRPSEAIPAPPDERFSPRILSPPGVEWRSYAPLVLERRGHGILRRPFQLAICGSPDPLWGQLELTWSETLGRPRAAPSRAGPIGRPTPYMPLTIVP